MAFVPGFGSFEFEQFFDPRGFFRSFEAARRALRSLRRSQTIPPPTPPEPDRIFRRGSRGLNLAGLGDVLEALQGSAADPTPIPPAPTPVPDPPPIDATVPAPEPIPPPAPPPVEEPTLEETVEKVFGGFENVPIFGAGQVIRGVVRPLIPKGFEAIKAIVKRMKRRVTEKPSERGRREAMRGIQQREAILRDIGKPRNVRVVRRPSVPSVDEVIFTKQDEAIAAARKVEREVLPKTKPATREIRGTEVKIGEIDTSRLPAKRTGTLSKASRTRQTQRTAAQKAATPTTTTPGTPRISISLLTRLLTRGSVPTVQGPIVGTGTSPAPIISTGTSPAPIIGTSPAPIIGTGTSPAPIIGTGTSPAPSPPFTDPLTPTQTFPGSGTQTQVLQFSRTGSRTKECQQVKRKRKRGRCFEGFYEERFGKTIFTDWREVDCLTGDTLPKLKEA